MELDNYELQWVLAIDSRKSSMKLCDISPVIIQRDFGTILKPNHGPSHTVNALSTKLQTTDWQTGWDEAIWPIETPCRLVALSVSLTIQNHKSLNEKYPDTLKIPPHTMGLLVHLMLLELACVYVYLGCNIHLFPIHIHITSGFPAASFKLTLKELHILALACRPHLSAPEVAA